MRLESPDAYWAQEHNRKSGWHDPSQSDLHSAQGEDPPLFDLDAAYDFDAMVRMTRDRWGDGGGKGKRGRRARETISWARTSSISLPSCSSDAGESDRTPSGTHGAH